VNLNLFVESKRKHVINIYLFSSLEWNQFDLSEFTVFIDKVQIAKIYRCPIIDYFIKLFHFWQNYSLNIKL